ncbi:hypothetical protein AcV7_004216 [Taiwanofungus camphoratus]|nr:hypothetical protein AcV7_004216 [Antrodia cinnamomea]
MPVLSMDTEAPVHVPCRHRPATTPEKRFASHLRTRRTRSYVAVVTESDGI